MRTDPSKACSYKRWYDSRKSAKRAARMIGNLASKQFTPYLCRICGGYHLTTREKTRQLVLPEEPPDDPPGEEKESR